MNTISMKTLSKLTLGAVAALALTASAALATGGGSCAANGGGNYCGGKAPSGCWCDTQCAQYGDCCGDVENICDPGEQPEPQPGPIDEPDYEAYELECYVEEFVLADLDPGQSGGFNVRCDEGYKATGEGTHVRNAQGGADTFDVDLQDFPSQNDDRDWAIRYRNRNDRGTVDLHAFARCCR